MDRSISHVSILNGDDGAAERPIGGCSSSSSARSLRRRRRRPYRLSPRRRSTNVPGQRGLPHHCPLQQHRKSAITPRRLGCWRIGPTAGPIPRPIVAPNPWRPWWRIRAGIRSNHDERKVSPSVISTTANLPLGSNAMPKAGTGALPWYVRLSSIACDSFVCLHNLETSKDSLNSRFQLLENIKLSFIWVFAQELVVSKGMVQGIAEGDADALTALVCFLTLIAGFANLVATFDTEGDFVDRVVDRRKLYENARNPNWQPAEVEPPYEPLPVSSLSPGAAASDPPSYDQYQRELEHALRAMHKGGVVPSPTTTTTTTGGTRAAAAAAARSGNGVSGASPEFADPSRRFLAEYDRRWSKTQIPTGHRGSISVWHGLRSDGGVTGSASECPTIV